MVLKQRKDCGSPLALREGENVDITARVRPCLVLGCLYRNRMYCERSCSSTVLLNMFHGNIFKEKTWKDHVSSALPSFTPNRSLLSLYFLVPVIDAGLANYLLQLHIQYTWINWIASWYQLSFRGAGDNTSSFSISFMSHRGDSREWWNVLYFFLFLFFLMFSFTVCFITCLK